MNLVSCGNGIMVVSGTSCILDLVLSALFIWLLLLVRRAVWVETDNISAKVPHRPLSFCPKLLFASCRSPVATFPALLSYSEALHCKSGSVKKLILIPRGIPDYRQYGNWQISPIPHFGHSLHNLNKIQQRVKDSSTESSPRCPQS